MADNTKSQIFRINLRTTGIYLDRRDWYQANNLILQFRSNNGSWVTLPKGSKKVTLSGSVAETIYNVDPNWENGASISSASFAGVPQRGSEREIAILVPDVSRLESLEYRVVGKNCLDCWEFYKNSDQADRALDESVDGGVNCAVLATGSFF